MEYFDFEVDSENHDTPENPKLVSSWKYEYEVFELVRIYKTFDWKRNVMIYYGY